MNKVFEDYFSEIQEDMVSICLEYVEKKAQKIYIYCASEDNTVTSSFFYKINGKIVERHKLNDAKSENEQAYDVSVKRQMAVLDILNEDIKALKKLCKDYNRDMPTQIKLIYDIDNNKLNTDYGYELYFSNSDVISPNDIEEKWFNSIKKQEEKL